MFSKNLLYSKFCHVMFCQCRLPYSTELLRSSLRTRGVTETMGDSSLQDFATQTSRRKKHEYQVNTA